MSPLLRSRPLADEKPPTLHPLSSGENPRLLYLLVQDTQSWGRPSGKGLAGGSEEKRHWAQGCHFRTVLARSWLIHKVLFCGLSPARRYTISDCVLPRCAISNCLFTRDV